MRIFPDLSLTDTAEATTPVFVCKGAGGEHCSTILRQLSREAGAVRLCNLDPTVVALAIECKPCNRHGRYRLEALIAAHGPRAGLPELRRVVVSGSECRGSVDPPRPCHARFWRLGKRDG